MIAKDVEAGGDLSRAYLPFLQFDMIFRSNTPASAVMNKCVSCMCRFEVIGYRMIAMYLFGYGFNFKGPTDMSFFVVSAFPGLR